jgi:hypothetical protein
MIRIIFLGLAAALLPSCQKEVDLADCPDLGSKKHSVEINHAQICMNYTAAKMSESSQHSVDIAKASMLYCEDEIAKMTSDIDDPLGAEKVQEMLKAELIEHTTKVVTAVRAASCLDKPLFRHMISQPISFDSGDPMQETLDAMKKEKLRR